jgi:DMSO/TMAO reductase YedYZ molybdopterin-dependent catalytic subunit
MPEESTDRRMAITRRQFLKATGFAALGGTFASPAISALAGDTIAMPFANGQRSFAKFPQKRPLILVTTRPPQLETPFSIFNDGVITPNDAFFVRYHLAEVPTSIDPKTFKVEIKGKVNSPLTLSLADLKTKFDATEIVAVNQCSGNSRGFSNPRVAGGQLGNGAMGNAKWKGVRLKDVLNKAGVAAGAKQVTFNGLDKAPLEKTPDFIKALEVEHALDEDTLLAYEMNGEALPMLNGFPLRLVVPGYYGTYWVKHVNEIIVVEQPAPNFWMDTAYRIPDNECACVEPGTTPAKTRPIGRYNVRSFTTSLGEGDKVKAGQKITVRGIAFDGGYGITEVSFSGDGGQTWREARLGKDFGKYSFREWTIDFKPEQSGVLELKVKATNRINQSQPLQPLWNPAGYMRNVVETVKVNAA